MTTREDEAREALRARQGAGARYDAPSAPHDDLLLARRGTAYFARKLNDLTDHELDAPSLREGWSRRHLIAHVSYHARNLARLIESARLGSEVSRDVSAVERDTEIELGATLPARALRHLFQHTEVHLNVEWRDLGDEAWNAQLRLHDGRQLAARQTPLLRAGVVWWGAIDLGNGGRMADIPRELKD